MKHWIACLSLLVVVFGSGCDTVNHSQIRIASPKREDKVRVAIPATEREAVKQVLGDIAARHHFEDRTSLSLVPDTLCSYAQADVKYPMRFMAWVKDNQICIDLFQKPPEAGETLAYQNLRDEIMAELKKQFGDRMSLVHKMNQVSGGPAKQP